MQTIKTAVVVVMLLAVLYGAYVALNGKETPLPQELLQMADLDVQVDFDANATRQSALPTSNNAPQSGSGFFVKNSAGGPKSLDPNANVVDTGLSFDPPKNNNNMNDRGSATGFAAPPPSLLSSTSSPSSTPASPFPAANGNRDNASASTSLPLTIPNASPSPNSSFSAPQLSLPSQHGTASNLAELTSNTSENPLTDNWGQGTSNGSNNSYAGSQGPGDPPSLGSDTDKNLGLPNATSSRSFLNAKKMAEEQIARGELKEALATLSLFYNAIELTNEQHAELLEMLDPLAGEVIYSRRHLLDIPYVVGQGEQLEDIAKQFEVPTELLARINAVDPTSPLPVGIRLKVVPGPFRGEIDLQRSELTLFVGEFYAGRFAISIGSQPAPSEGVYQIVEKQRNRNFYGPGGTQINGNDPRNPYGGWWMDLGQDVCIHGTPEQPSPNSEKMGCISLSPIDASDVYGMLSRGSKVQIRR